MSMPQNTGTGFENRPWPDPELDNVSPWPPPRPCKPARPRVFTLKTVIAGSLVVASTSIFFIALNVFVTTW